MNTLQEFLDELKKPRHERKYIDKKTWKRFKLMYQLSPEVLDNKRKDAYLDAKNQRTKMFRR